MKISIPREKIQVNFFSIEKNSFMLYNEKVLIVLSITSSEQNFPSLKEKHITSYDGVEKKNKKITHNFSTRALD